MNEEEVCFEVLASSADHISFDYENVTYSYDVVKRGEQLHFSNGATDFTCTITNFNNTTDKQVFVNDFEVIVKDIPKAKSK